CRDSFISKAHPQSRSLQRSGTFQKMALLGREADQVLLCGHEALGLMLPSQLDQFGEVGVGEAMMIAPRPQRSDGTAFALQGGGELLGPGDATESDHVTGSGDGQPTLHPPDGLVMSPSAQFGLEIAIL